MKIRTAIFAVYVGASALGFTVLMAFVLKEVRPRYVESMRRTLADTAALLAAMAEEELALTPGAGLAEVWRNVPQSAGALRVFVTDVREVAVYDSAGGRDVGSDYSVGVATAESFKAVYGWGQDVNLVEGELRVSAPVRREGVVIGRVGVARPLSSVTEAILRARLRLVAGSFAVAAIMVAAAWWIAAKLTGSLERLTAYVEGIRDGRAGRPPESRASEVAALARAFEEMRVALEGKAYVERYTQSLAHEVKAPLSAIRGAAELLQEDLPAEERARFLAHLRTESERIQAIIDRMLRLAALEARRGLEVVEDVEVGGVVREAIESLRPVWGGHGVEVVLRAGGDEGRGRAVVRGEKFLLVQAIVNLVRNAVEFSPAGAVVVVRVEPAGRTVRVVVDDHGPGVPTFARDRIFERFYSLPRPGGRVKSTGLGLSFVREIATLHGGSATVQNREEGGARAVLTLPVSPEIAAEPADLGQTPRNSSKRG